MRIPLVILASILVALPVEKAVAADFSDPEWPCVQRKVERLSLGVMWAQPVPEGPLPDAVDDAAKELVSTLVLRRVPLDEAEALIDRFVANTPEADNAVLGQIFRDVFTRIDNERTRLIGGISRYSLAQIEAAKRIDDLRVEMDMIMAQEEPDFDRVDVIEEQLDWDQRIYRDRALSLTYVCETPVLMEKRAYAIAQALAKHLN
ncbi:MAG: hypothetical protein AAFW87_02935 [Pseudomonadota bacterium]